MEKRLFSGFLAIVTAIFLFSSLGSCSKDEDPEVSVASVSMSQASLSLEVGATATLTATVSPSDATNKAISWTSSNSTVATVSNGVVTAVAEGSATITAMAGGKTATCLVTIKPKPEEKVLVVGNAATVPAKGATVEVDVQYNVEYTVEVEASAQSWIHYVETRAVQSGKLVFKVDANDGDERSGKVTLKDKSGTVDPVTITITQEPEEKVLIVGDAATVPAVGATVEVDVQYNVEYTVEVETSAQSWIHYVETRAVQSGKLVFKVDANDGDKRSGKVTLKDKSGTVDPVTITITQEKPDEETTIKKALMKIYDAMDGPHWKMTNKWDLSKPLSSWDFVVWDEYSRVLELLFSEETGLKGEFPDCFGDLTQLQSFSVYNETGVTGTLPPSFKKLKNMKYFQVHNSSMTSLPDVFEEMKSLESVDITENHLMTGSLPESLGRCPELITLIVGRNAFTGKVPDSWAQLGTGLLLEEAFLDERVPDSFVQSPDAYYLVNMYITQNNWRTAPVTVGDYDIPAFWPKRDIKDVVTGKTIDFKNIFSKNKVTILLNWATWCPFSKELMPNLKRMYDKYHSKGLEIIAAYNADEPGKDQGKSLKEGILERNYDKWYNFDIWDLYGWEWGIWCAGTPSAILVDDKGMTIASSKVNVSDPARNRFGYTASTNLMPLLEELFGPLDEEDDYSSTDYSKDGEVLTLQKATVGKGINVVFMGDAYTDRDIDNGYYQFLMEQSMEEFFAIEPYKTFRDRFNVYAVKVVSKHGRTGQGYTTALGSVATYNSISTGNLDKCYEYALKVPGIKDDKNLLIGVLVNSASGRGITTMSESKQSSVAFYGSASNDFDAFGNTLRHEAGGHGFAFLDDEYETMQGEAPKDHIDHRNSMYKKYGWYSNVDFTNDRSKVKWSAFLSDDRYKNEVGIFEGGSLYSKGAYRPSDNSMMRDNYEYFNAPSRWAIYQRIMKLSGEECTFEKFLKYDAVNRGASTDAAKQLMKGATNRRVEHSAPPVIVP
jgi:thiol-disulfide isomerase/thioredoxin/translation initiation factor 2 alpha subunit (eIF-2alpha)